MRKFLSSISGQVVALSIAQAVLVAILLFSLYYWSVQNNAVEQSVAQANSIVLGAEAVRNDMAEKWRLGVFSQEDMKKWAEEGKTDKILSAVPIVAAWKAALGTSDGNNLLVKTPKFNPRNPDNEPDKVEASVLKEFASSPHLTEKVVHDKELNAVRYFRPIRLTDDCMLCHGSPAKSEELWGNNVGMDGTGHRMENLRVGDLHGAFEIIKKLDDSQRAATMAAGQGFLVFSIIIAISVTGFVFLIRRNVSKPISDCVHALGKMATGDLTQTIDVNGKGEVGVLQSAMNQMQSRFRTILRSIDGYSQNLHSTSEELAETSQQLNENSTVTKESTTTVSAATEEMSINVRQMANSSDTIQESVLSVSAAVEQLRSASEQVGQNAKKTTVVAQDAVKIAQESSRQIEQLDEAAKQIGTVSQLIQDIAEQTNLLALNATIEAARAGETGKGFAVVASEVKSLAKQTAQATEGIRARIESMQEASSSAANAIRMIEQVIDTIHNSSGSIVEALESQDQATVSISSSVDQASREIQSFSSSARESAAATQEVARCMTTVESGAVKAVENAAKTREQGQKLFNLSNEFKGILQEFKI